MASARPRDWVTARLQVSAPGQATTSRASSAPGSAMPMASRRAYRVGNWFSVEAPEGEVLAVGEAHLEPELAGGRGQRPELVGGDVAQAGVGDGRHRALGHPAHHVGVDPTLVGLGAPQGHRRALTDDGGGDPGGDAGGGVAELLHDLGDATGPARAGQQELAGVQHPAAHLVDAQLVDDPLEAGPQLVVAVAGLLEDPQHRLDGGQELLLGGELLEDERRVRVGPEPAGDEHPEALLDGAVVVACVTAATTPTSLNMAWPQSVSQPEKLILNLRGSRWANGWRRKCWKAASAHGLTSNASNGQAPARWQAMTLRTVSPHASRVVMPTDGQQAHDLGDALEVDEVELDVLAGRDVAPATRVGLADVGHHVELLGGDGAVGRLDPHHLAVPALALAVDAVVQAEHPEDVLGEVAGQVAGQLLLELGDVGGGLDVDLSLQHGRASVGRGHERDRSRKPTNPIRNSPFVAKPERIPQEFSRVPSGTSRPGLSPTGEPGVSPAAGRPTRKARSSDWRALSRGSHIVS